jgi:hypothetical protein
MAALGAVFTQATLERGAFDLAPRSAVVRATGGVEGFAGPGVLALAWVLPRDVLVTPEKLLNTACRPLLHWLKSLKVPASYFGRDVLALPDGEVVRLGLTATSSTWLLEARVAWTSSLDVPGAPLPVWKKPGDRKVCGTLVSVSRQVPTDGEAALAGLMDTLRQAGVEVLSQADVVAVEAPPPTEEAGFGAGVEAPLGRVRARADGWVVGPYFASLGLPGDVQRGMTAHGNAGRAVLEALAVPGAFLLGADAEHLVAALREARGES